MHIQNNIIMQQAALYSQPLQLSITGTNEGVLNCLTELIDLALGYWATHARHDET